MEKAAIDLIKQLLDRGNLVETVMLLLRMYYELMPNSVLVGLYKDPLIMEVLRPQLIKIGGRVYRKNPIQEQPYQHEEEDDDYYQGNLSRSGRAHV